MTQALSSRAARRRRIRSALAGPLPLITRLNSAQSMAWGNKRHSNDEQRQRFVDMSVPQAEVLGVTLPDPDLALDPETGRYRFGAIDWDEFKRVISGGGPMNDVRIARRRAARDDNAWVTEAATAYARKHSA